MTFVYDRDGNRVKATFNGTTTIYVGNHYEKQGSTVRKYYYAGGQRVAVREGSNVYWLLTDHLGSTAITAYYSSGNRKTELRYYPWGETRYSYGTTPPKHRFTGQVHDDTIGLYFYNARYYDPALGRFISADTIVPNPGNPQDLNRYAYARNNPLRYTDPSGHAADPGGGGGVPWPPPPSKDPGVILLEVIDQLIWHSIPSGAGVYVSPSFGENVILGIQGTVPQVVWVFNWHSGELSLAVGGGAAVELGTPQGLNAGIAGGLVLPMGYSSNDMLLGTSLDLGFELQADMVAKAGLDAGMSWEMVVDPDTGGLVPACDFRSDMQPYMAFVGLGIGANEWPNVIEESVSLGVSYTPFMATAQLYPWNWTRR